jgi:hypothetical protein
MKRDFAVLFVSFAILSLAGCTRSFAEIPTPTPMASPTSLASTPAQAVSAIDPGALTATAAFGLPGSPLGPYAVIYLSPGEALNIRSAPGTNSSVTGSFSSITNVMLTGSDSSVDGYRWVQVQTPGGGTGWVAAAYLTEYAAPAAFCADVRVNTLLANFGNALATSNGTLLTALVSPAHGMTVRLWRYGIPHTFWPKDAGWIFESTYEHDWGEAPGSGLDTVGSFHEKVLPWLREVYNAGYSLTCNSLGTAAQYGSNPWPVEYANINYYTVYKPGTPGMDLDFRYWLVGVEYVQGQPYIFGLIHFAWEP